jgi:hypothetical protein
MAWVNWCPGYQRDAHPASDLTVDHVVPLAAGGAPFDIANCAVLCRSCNSTKGAGDADRGSLHAGSALLEDRGRVQRRDRGRDAPQRQPGGRRPHLRSHAPSGRTPCLHERTRAGLQVQGRDAQAPRNDRSDDRPRTPRAPGGVASDPYTPPRANHLPAADDASEGFWRRIALIPWAVRFAKRGEAGDGPAEDPGLATIVAGEAPGILAWAVRGAVAYATAGTLHPFPAAAGISAPSRRPRSGGGALRA